MGDSADACEGVMDYLRKRLDTLPV
jgi:hypothetical protein